MGFAREYVGSATALLNEESTELFESGSVGTNLGCTAVVGVLCNLEAAV